MSTFDKQSIGTRIKELREKRGWTQEDLVEKLKANENVERSTLAKWETGRQDFKTKHIIALAEIFGVTSDYLLGLSITPSVDYDTKMICDYTGLDEKSIEFLHYEPDTTSLEIINAFIKSYEFWDIIDELQNIENLHYFITQDCKDKIGYQGETLKESIKMLDSYYTKNPKFKNDLKQLTAHKQNLKLAQFGCDNSFTDIVKAYVDGRELTPYYFEEDES
jgi:transcriptional regulator with XRE-family HTH domain